MVAMVARDCRKDIDSECDVSIIVGPVGRDL